MRWLKSAGDWLDQRLQIGPALRGAMFHRVPRSSASWLYVFGSSAFLLLLLQVVTGILLALVYVPSGAEAWNSLQVLNHDIALGWFLRAVHGWGSNFMVALVLLHMMQVFLFGAYKYPREFNWITGVFLLLCTLGMAFTGQIMRFDQDAYWGLGIGASITGRIPVIGGPVVHLLLGGPIIGGDTLSRFFDLHVFVIPGLLLGLVGLHLLMVLKLGINEWPMPGRVVRRATYLKEYEELSQKDGVPFIPDAIWKDMIVGAAVLAAVLVCAAVFGPFGPRGQPDPLIIDTAPRPDLYFLWLFAVLALLPPQLETAALLIAPVIVITLLILLPFLSGEGEKSWRRRPVSVMSLLLIVVTLGILTRLGRDAPWSPVMNAWSGLPAPAADIKGRSALERQGAIVFQEKQCRNCHQLGGTGGMRGPALDSVATRLTSDQLIRQVIQGGGNMPAYGKNLSPAEVTALVSFLETLHSPGQRPARDASEAGLPALDTGIPVKR
jgi:ubiquinol-cytochrome c reductase cytochrome b subunit